MLISATPPGLRASLKPPLGAAVTQFTSARCLAFQSLLIVDLNSNPQPDGSLCARLGSECLLLKKKSQLVHSVA